VILRAAFIMSHYTILKTSIEYGIACPNLTDDNRSVRLAPSSIAGERFTAQQVRVHLGSARTPSGSVDAGSPIRGAGQTSARARSIRLNRNFTLLPLHSLTLLAA
jgi:hypothetical protein